MKKMAESVLELITETEFMKAVDQIPIGCMAILKLLMDQTEVINNSLLFLMKM